MPRKPRPLNGGTPKKPKSAPKASPAAWRFVVFTDLHVRAETLDRACEVLDRVGALAKEHQARILCLGDFWHQRGNLVVRQVQQVLDCTDRWAAEGIEAIFIPGNHDQVTMSGLVHGIRLFDAYPNCRVIDLPYNVEEHQIAFIPWREAPEAQAAAFAAVPAGWTVFAHAEAPGAASNSGHLMAGRFALPKARAVYLGHFHRRQKIGDNCWYIGSPFEMAMGERDQPHGVAIVSSDQLEPSWITWDDFPKHHRIEVGDAVPVIRPGDVVELLVSPSEMGSSTVQAFLEAMPPADVRMVPVKAEAEAEVPQFALSLDEALETWVGAEVLEDPVRAVRLKLLGRTLLGQVPEAKKIQPKSGRVRVKQVVLRNFCGVRGPFVFDVPKGEVLLRGPMGVGKTSVLDAITWCLYGSTSPRKAGSHGASLRADEVIHDSADECYVSVVLVLDGEKQVQIARSKKRGTGAQVLIEGVETGISDQQAQILALIGIDHDLWRTCVYLGQGAVGTFVTDADKKRKELLSTAFGLSACPQAQKLTREALKAVLLKTEQLERDIAGDERVVEVLRETDFAAQIAEWESERAQELARCEAETKEVAATIAQCEAHLAGEEQWLSSKAQHEEAVTRLTKSLAAAAPSVQIANAQREYGGLEAERAVLERDLALAKRKLTEYQQKPGVCPVCGKPFDPQADQQHILDLEQQIQAKSREIDSFTVRLSNVAERLDQLHREGSAASEGVRHQLEESQAALAKCGEALSVFVRLRSNREQSQQRLAALAQAYERAKQRPNPYAVKQAEARERILTVEAKLQATRRELAGYAEQQADLAFWERAFGQHGLPALVLRAALHELETHANRFMAQLLGGKIFCRLSMLDDDLRILFLEADDVSRQPKERRYEQLSGGQRRCVELAFNPFALSELVFSRCGVRVELLVVDELTTHLGQAEKPLVCDLLRSLGRESVVVIDHDPVVAGEFDQVLDLAKRDGWLAMERAQ